MIFKRALFGVGALIAVLALLPSCDTNGDFVFGVYDYDLYEVVLDAWSGPSGENAQGVLKMDGFVLGYVGCLKITGKEALVGLDMSPSVGLTALARVSDLGDAGADVIRLSPSGLPSSAVCDADLEPGPSQPGNFVVRDLVP